MNFSAIENILRMTNGGTVSGRGPTVIKDAQFDSKSGDAVQIDLAKKSLVEQMRKATERETPVPPRPTALTEQELTELSTGQVDQVLGAIRKKLIKRAVNGRTGSMKNIADYAKAEIMGLQEEYVLSEMDPDAALERMADAHGEGDHDEAKEAASDLRDWLRKGGFKPKVKPGHHAAIKAHMGSMASKLLGESNTKPGDLNVPSYAEQKPKTRKMGYDLSTEFAMRTGATKQAQTMESPPSMSSRTADGKQAEPLGESDKKGEPEEGTPEWHDKMGHEAMRYADAAHGHGAMLDAGGYMDGANWHFKKAAELRKKKLPGGPLRKLSDKEQDEIEAKKARESVEEAQWSRAEHMQWAKKRAHRELQNSGPHSAIMSMISDLQKHPETERHAGVSFGLAHATGAFNDHEAAKKFIDGFGESVEEAKDPHFASVVVHPMKGDYDKSGRYFGALNRGEKMFQLTTHDGDLHYARAQTKDEAKEKTRSKVKKNESVEEAAMSDSENKAGAAAAGEKKFDKVWDQVEPESKRIAGVAGRTGCKAPLKLKEAIAAFQETTDLSDALQEYNTAAGKVSGQKVYTDPVATMQVNSAYRTDLLKLSAGKGKVAGAPGSVKTRGVKPGDPIGD